MSTRRGGGTAFTRSSAVSTLQQARDFVSGHEPVTLRARFCALLIRFGEVVVRAASMAAATSSSSRWKRPARKMLAEASASADAEWEEG